MIRTFAAFALLGMVAFGVSQGQDKKTEPKKGEKKKAEPKPVDLTEEFAAKDPDFAVQGEYAETSDGKGKYAAQVVAKANGKFEVYLLEGGLPGAGWDGKSKVKLNGTTKDSATTFADKTWEGTIADGVLSAKGPVEIKLKRIVRLSPTLGARPPEGATVLFDGTTAEYFSGGKIVGDKYLLCGCNSKKGFATGTLHLEFRSPYEPKDGGQGRGNSGVYILGKEIQVLDSFGLKGENNECGGFYGFVKPAVNMCLPPLAWQTYDVEIKPDGKGNLVANVKHNGVVVHEAFNIAKEGAKPASINLQNHGDAVVYRNIWLVETK
ncbi:MAG: DUF1080 domain-containing protein [Gemmataceae bacterium]|nr:DUF1080 domain-containing protein [Gemmataceae bacterium]